MKNQPVAGSSQIMIVYTLNTEMRRLSFVYMDVCNVLSICVMSQRFKISLLLFNVHLLCTISNRAQTPHTSLRTSPSFTSTWCKSALLHTHHIPDPLPNPVRTHHIFLQPRSCPPAASSHVSFVQSLSPPFRSTRTVLTHLPTLQFLRTFHLSCNYSFPHLLSPSFNHHLQFFACDQ